MRKLDFPVFDADNHLYEAEDAFTRHLPAAARQPVPVRRDPRDARSWSCGTRSPSSSRTRPSRSSPDPGAHMAFYAAENAGRQDAARAHRRADGVHPGVPLAGARASSCSTSRACTPRWSSRPWPASSRNGCTTTPHLTQVAIHAFNEWLLRRVDLRLRGSPVRDADREPVPARRGHRRARAAVGAGSEGRAVAAGAGERAAGSALAVPARVRPVLGPRRGGGRARRAARVRQRLPGLPQHLGGQPTASTSRSGPRPSRPWPTAVARSRTRWPRRSATARSPGSPASSCSASRTEGAGWGSC